MSTKPTTLPTTDKAGALEGDWLLNPEHNWTKPESSLYNWVSQGSGYFEDGLPAEQRLRLTMVMLRAFDAEIKRQSAAPATTTSPAATDAKQTAASPAAPAQPSPTPTATP